MALAPPSVLPSLKISILIFVVYFLKCETNGYPTFDWCDKKPTEPVCATNGRTFRNQCFLDLFNQNNARRAPYLAKERNGPCNQRGPPYKRDQFRNDYGNDEEYAHYGPIDEQYEHQPDEDAEDLASVGSDGSDDSKYVYKNPFPPGQGYGKPGLYGGIPNQNQNQNQNPGPVSYNYGSGSNGMGVNIPNPYQAPPSPISNIQNYNRPVLNSPDVYNASPLYVKGPPMYPSNGAGASPSNTGQAMSPPGAYQSPAPAPAPVPTPAPALPYSSGITMTPLIGATTTAAPNMYNYSPYGAPPPANGGNNNYGGGNMYNYNFYTTAAPIITTTASPLTTTPQITTTASVTTTPLLTTTALPLTTTTPPELTTTPIFTTLPPLTTTPQLTTTVPPLITTTPAQTTNPEITTTAAPLITTTPLVTEPPLITTTPLVTEPPLITTTPLVTEPPLITTTPLVTEPPLITTTALFTEPPTFTTPPVTELPQTTAAEGLTTTPLPGDMSTAPPNGLTTPSFFGTTPSGVARLFQVFG